MFIHAYTLRIYRYNSLNVTFHKWNYISDSNSMRTTIYKNDRNTEENHKYQTNKCHSCYSFQCLKAFSPHIYFLIMKYKNTKRFTLWRRQYRISEAWWQTSVATYKPKYSSHNINSNHKWKRDFYLFIFVDLENIHNRQLNVH